MAWIVERISLAEVKAHLTSSGRQRPMIYYAVGTCWWSHIPETLYRHPENGLPCDPRGSVLLQTDAPLAWIEQAEANPEHYGRHGLRAFMAAHALNCQRGPEDHRPWSLGTWEAYNDLLDELDALRGVRSP